MSRRTSFYLYLALSAACILANFVLWRYRLHLYDLNTDYDIEPLHHIQMILFRATLALISIGWILLRRQGFFDKK